MIHPHTELRRIDPVLGYGVFATDFIPKGTITFAKDPFDVEVTPEQFDAMSELLKNQTERYSYMDERGIRIVSWDLAKYVNHRCNCNTLSTGYGFEIAIQDIQPGDEITDDYGLFNVTEPMTLTCACPNCRGQIRPDDLDTCYPEWDRKVQDALPLMLHVTQPLWSLLDPDTIEQVTGYLADRRQYKSVTTLKANAGPQIIELRDVMTHQTPHYQDKPLRTARREH
ncbi:MAG: SET domain-containing protein-lysine N-methyltransferase [Phycisphaerae bacterium]|nr:SET domain-containing protein-lysine N-methyltransferase [Phycisphaerae bacterium]